MGPALGLTSNLRPPKSLPKASRRGQAFKRPPTFPSWIILLLAGKSGLQNKSLRRFLPHLNGPACIGTKVLDYGVGLERTRLGPQYLGPNRSNL